MKIPFEAWLASQSLDEESRSLFEESLLCYQARAYRAALVFSYLGFLRYLAGRLLTSPPPSGFPQTLWDSLQRDIRDDTLWEAITLDAALRIQPAQVFLLDDDTRQQLRYWRGRRNDAAHSRGNQISYAHVEMLWLFIESNSGRFVVNGGPEGLLERFIRHYDPTITPPELDSAELVQQIPHSVPTGQYHDFLRKLLTANVFRPHRYYEADIPPEAEFLLISLEKLGNASLLSAFATELKANKGLLISVLLSRPNFVLHYAADPQLLRDVWHDHLPFARVRSFNAIPESLRVVAVMLRNNLVQEALRTTVMDHVVAKISEDSSMREPYPDDLLEELQPFGFWNAVRRHGLLGDDHVEWAAGNLELMLRFVEHNGVDADVASLFCQFFPEDISHPEDDYPSFRASRLQEPEDYFDLQLYFGEHSKTYRAIVATAKKYHFDYQYFEKLVGPR